MIQPLPVQFGLVEQVYDRLVQAITEGRLAPGERITQDEIAAKLGVSRQPVSHALHILRRRGLLIEGGRRGLIVAPLDADRLRQLYQVRAALDALAASLAAPRARNGALSAAEIKGGRELVARGSALVPGGSVAELVAADVAFHSLLHRWSGNGAIVETVAEVWPHFMRSMGTVLADPAIRERVWREHADILDQVLAGDTVRAKAAARRHTELVGEETAASLERSAAVA